MLTQILVVLAVLVAVFVIVVATRPADFCVRRSAAVAAPAAAVFAQVNDFRKWTAWNPWEKVDPAMKLTYSGPASGAGASYAWEGNNQVGAGRMTITESRPSDLIRIKLEFLKPFASICATEFTFKPEGQQTTVTWSMAGRKNFVTKAIHMFMNMDKMIGGQFEKGLADMRVAAEAAK